VAPLDARWNHQLVRIVEDHLDLIGGNHIDPVHEGEQALYGNLRPNQRLTSFLLTRHCRAKVWSFDLFLDAQRFGESLFHGHRLRQAA
jgi:hypothetical protein